MLVFLPTTANSFSSKKQKTTFNQITVDGDTSTNDMVLVLANGLAKNPVIEENSAAYEKFVAMFQLIS